MKRYQVATAAEIRAIFARAIDTWGQAFEDGDDIFLKKEPRQPKTKATNARSRL